MTLPSHGVVSEHNHKWQNKQEESRRVGVRCFAAKNSFSTGRDDELVRKITNAGSIESILSIAYENRNLLKSNHVSKAFNMMGRTANQSRETNLMKHKTFGGLLFLARQCAERGQSDTKDLSLTIHGLAKLHQAGKIRLEEDTLKTLLVLEDAVVKGAVEMTSQSLANILWAYGRLERMPSDKALAALENGVVVVMMVVMIMMVVMRMEVVEVHGYIG